ncbi:LytR family transcriptional attenuator [Tumebacillus sp. BK434]|uniref:LCP family protein n=1 Tax=Tumebacillus sp. BK434 TaxID=2512169 RepID=UPI00104858D4|nr:LCP family protein [Tumebacillus sp. BK434]TCP57807.1 LytR family transcriptional attenuator [Tumebacillus sp. BK434]
MAYQGKSYSKQVKPQPKPRKKLRIGRFLLILFVFVIVMGLTGLAGYGFYLERKVVERTAATAPLVEGEPVNVLLIGMDRDPGSGEEQRRLGMNTDTLIVAQIDPAGKQAALLSIPRDTRVQLPTGMEKINAAYSIGGMDRLTRTVEELTGLKIDRYVMIDFQGFQQAIDAVGGVEFEVDKELYDPEGRVHLQPGKQLLNGLEALTAVRFRHEAMGDIARVERQQRFVEAYLSKIQQTNVVDWMNSLRKMSQSLRTDMSISEMGKLATAMQGEGAQFETHTVPGTFLEVYGISYWKADPAKLQEIVSQMKN